MLDVNYLRSGLVIPLPCALFGEVSAVARSVDRLDDPRINDAPTIQQVLSFISLCRLIQNDYFGSDTRVSG